ncbi:MAG: hypothetical protein ABFS43_12980 [Thermodesulfobacteriota bacterium]
MSKGSHTQYKKLLILDGAVNLLLGVLLLCFPLGLATWLGVPEGGLNFYPGILGAVLFGIGVALLLEAYGEQKGIRGLGLEGAIAINICGAGALVVWLLAVPLEISLRGYVVLWVIVLSVLLIGIVELVHQVCRRYKL